MKPVVSIVMAVYNGQAWVERAIDSILNQDFSNFEFIIIDDGSTDKTPTILMDYASQDDRIRILTNTENIGLTASLNKGIGQAKGIYIARQDADDVSHPERLSSQVEVLNKSNNVGLVTTYFQIDDGEKTGTYQQYSSAIKRRWALLFYNQISGHSAVMFRKDIFDQIGGYDENLRYAQDYDLWVRLQAVSEIGIIERPLLTMYFHENNISNTKKEQQTDIASKISQRQLEALVGQLDLKAVRELYYFWTHQFEKVTDYKRINRDLKHIFDAFSKEYEISPYQRAEVRSVIAQQWWRSIILTEDKFYFETFWIMFQWTPRYALTRLWRYIRSS